MVVQLTQLDDQTYQTNLMDLDNTISVIDEGDYADMYETAQEVAEQTGADLQFQI